MTKEIPGLVFSFLLGAAVPFGAGLDWRIVTGCGLLASACAALVLFLANEDF